MNEFDKRAYADLAGARAILDEAERMRKLIAPFDDSVARAVAGSPADFGQLAGVKALIDEQQRMKRLVAPLADPVAWHLAKATPTATQILEEQSARDMYSLHKAYTEIEAARELAKLEDRYNLPTWDNLLEREVKRVVAENGLLPTETPTGWLDAMKQSVLQRQQPWLNELEPISSIRALTEIQLLGIAINTVNPFSDLVTETTRKVLGDWSSVTTLPSEIFTDAVARREFYLAHGYDSALSSLTAPARLESRYLSGLSDRPPVVQVDHDGANADVSGESDGFALASEARETLAALERELREFLDTKMTAICGNSWTKQRVPAGIVKNIRERRADDTRLNNKNHPAVAYLDFPDYAAIIVRGDNWKEVFKDYFLRQTSVEESFHRLSPIRNAVMHSRALTQEDMDFLYVEVRRLQIAMRRAIPDAAAVDSDDE